MLNTSKEISSYQFATFRILFGLYLAVHFFMLVPFGPELFSGAGVLPDPSVNPTYRLFPNVLSLVDSPAFVVFFLCLLGVFSLLFAGGIARPAMAIALWYGWACLFNRNVLISNPSIPYVGLLLLLSAVVPAGEALSPAKTPHGGWRFPAVVFAGAWFLMAAGYTYSGIIKLFSPSWVDGSAMVHLVNNPLARPGAIRDAFLDLPRWATAGATWFSLAGEILFLPLSVFRRGRLIAWIWMLAMHIGILGMVSFADLTMGMVMLHLFTFDPAWLPARKKSLLVLYDGVCGLCDKTVQTLLAEDREKILTFAPLQGPAAAEVRERAGGLEGVDSVLLVENWKTPDETVYVRSTAIMRIFDAIGGFWRVVALARFVPRRVRDAAYDFVGRNRYKWFGKFDACKIPDPATRQRFID